VATAPSPAAPQSAEEPRHAEELRAEEVLAEDVPPADAATVTAATMATDAPPEIAFGPPPTPPPPGRRARILIPVIVVAVLVLLSLVAIPLAIRGANSAGTQRRAVAASPSASPSSPPLTPEKYQLALDDADKDLGTRLAKLANALTYKAVGVAASDLVSALSLAVFALKAVTPPAAARAAHDQFVTGLDALASQATLASGTEPSHEICGGASSLSQLTSTPAADQVRAAVAALGTADPAHAYKVAPFLPAATPMPNRRLSNGNLIKRSSRGPNTVKVINRFGVDLVLSLAPAGSKTASLQIYVRHGETASATSVPDGNYDLYVANGDDWDTGAKIFTRNCTYSAFSDAQLKSTSRTYDVLTLTLGVEDGSGNMSGAPTDPDSFPA
jgi:hypothetical protein